MKNHENNSKEQCQCTQHAQGLFLLNRQVSLIVAGLLVMSFFLFVGGYFWGQKNAATSFSNKIDQESFGDQIYSSLCSLCDNGDVEEDGDEDNDNEETNDSASNVASVEQAVEPQPAIEPLKNEQKAQVPVDQEASLALSGEQAESLANDQAIASEIQGSEEEVSTAQYYAQLAGFGTVRAAQQFAQKLARKEIAVVVKKRQSRSARGRFVSWYQVITEKFADKVELENLVSRLEQEEKLKDVHIVTC